MISVVVPVRHESRTLAPTVERLLETLPPRSEVVVGDDGSTDGSAHQLSQFGSDCRLLRSEGGLGIAAARNWGAAEARGDAIAFCDAHVWVGDGVWGALVAAWEDPRVGASLLGPARSAALECHGVLQGDPVDPHAGRRRCRDGRSPQDRRPLPVAGDSLRRSGHDRSRPAGVARARPAADHHQPRPADVPRPRTAADHVDSLTVQEPESVHRSARKNCRARTSAFC